MSTKQEFRQAATVILVRDSHAGLEIYMTERPGTQDFPGLHVFPGGKVDDQDHQVEHYCQSLSDTEASMQLNLDSGGLGYWVTAIRECFEEAGVLLAYSRKENNAKINNTQKNPQTELLTSVDDHLNLRESLHSQSLSLGELCRTQDLTLATNQMLYFSHWITPAPAPRRYDTRFFICEMPKGQQACHDKSEVASATWISPENALKFFQLKEWRMIDPTLRSLEVLARYSNTHDLFSDIKQGVHLQEVTTKLAKQGMQFVPQFASTKKH